MDSITNTAGARHDKRHDELLEGTGTCRSATVVYQCFCDGDHEHTHIGHDLRELARVFGPASGLSLYVQRIPLRPTPAYSELARRCERYTTRQRAAAIRLALWDYDLFDFGSPELEQIVL